MNTETGTGSTSWDRIGPYDARKNKLALGMFVILLISYVLNAMDRQLFSILATDVREDLGLSVPQVGLASTIFTLGMGLGGIPTGFLLARMPRKNVALLGLAVFSAATLLTAFSRGLADLLLYRFISGVGEAMQLTALLAIGTTYFLNHRAVAASSLNFTFGIGAIIGPNLGAALLTTYSWQAPLVVFGLTGLPLFILIAVIVRSWFTEYNSGDDEVAAPLSEGTAPGRAPGSDAEAAGTSGSGSPTKGMNRATWLLVASTVFAGLAIYGYLGLYPTFLREQLGFTPGDAGFAVSLYGLGAMLSLLGGWLGDRFNFRWVLAVSFVVAAPVGYLLFTDIRSLTVQAVLSFVFGGAISGMVYANLSAGIIKTLPRSMAGKGAGLFVASLYIPAGFAGLLIGKLAEVFSWTTAGLIQLGLFSLIAAVLALAARTSAAVPVRSAG